MRETLGRAPRRRRWNGPAGERGRRQNRLDSGGLPEIFWVNSTRRRGVFDLVVEAVHRQPFSAPDSLVSGKITGNLSSELSSWLTSKPRNPFSFPAFATAASITRAQSEQGI